MPLLGKRGIVMAPGNYPKREAARKLDRDRITPSQDLGGRQPSANLPALEIAAHNWSHAQEVAHLSVDKAVDTAMEALFLEAYRAVRKKLHTTAQLLAHFFAILFAFSAQAAP